jgi:hypothetical protein
MNYIELNKDNIKNANDIITFLYKIDYVKKVVSGYNKAGKLNTILSPEDVEQTLYEILIRKGNTLMEKLNEHPNKFFGYVRSLIGRQITLPHSKINYKFSDAKKYEILTDNFNEYE